MKINKVILRISHFFGCRKGEEHIDDVKMQIDDFKWSRGQIDDFMRSDSKREESDYVIDDIKSQVKQEFSNNPKFEKRCRNAHQVWIVRNGLMKMLYYRDGHLYYPCKKDRVVKERDDKLRDILK